MKKVIRHLRKQSEETRRHILHLLTVIFAILLLTLWVYSLGTNLSDENTEAKIEQSIKPFSALKDNLPSLW